MSPMYRIAVSLPLLLACCWSSVSADEPKIDTLVFCPAKFQAALQPWVDYRSRQGHRIRVVEPKSTPVELNAMIRAQAKMGGLKNLLLIGDSRTDRDWKNRGALVPTDYIKAKVNVIYGAAPDIATDNKYADLDGDGAPDLTVGRIPVDTADQLKIIVRKIIDYEKKLSNSVWRRKINFIAGVGGFGVVEDKVIENATKKLITSMVPHEYETSMTYASWNSPYCPDPRQFSQTTIDRLNEGCLFWVYIGHGHFRQLDYVNLPQKRYKIFDVKQTEQIKSKTGLPIAIFLACNTCGFDHAGDCIGEQLIKQPLGPVAVLGGSRITMPYGMSVMSLELMNDYFSGGQPTLGELIRITKSHLVLNDGEKGEFREMLDALGKAFSPTAHLMEAERKEHAQLMHLLGDPLLRLARPKKINVKAPKTAVSGKPITIEVDAPFAGKATVEIAYRRDRLTFRPPRRKSGIFTSEELKEFQNTYLRANQLVKSSKEININQPGMQTVELPLPADARGACIIRVFMANKSRFAMGSQEIQLKKAVGE